jgi:hypothetical protein
MLNCVADDIDLLAFLYRTFLHIQHFVFYLF